MIAGFLLAQINGAAQKRGAVFLQRITVNICRKHLPGAQRTQEFLLRVAEAFGCADGAEAQFQQHILPEEHRIQRVSKGCKVFRYKVRNFLAHAGL